jgi:uncharacterized protein YjbI with pentapeptide repeats
MEQLKLDEILKNHKVWLETNGEKGSCTNLRYVNLSGTDLRGADLDFSCWPLWCGSKNVTVDLKLIYQLLAHVACLQCADPEFAEIKKAIMEYAVKSHRAKDLGIEGK